MLAHEDRFLTYITRHENLAHRWEQEISGLYDVLLEHYQPLHDLGIIDDLRGSASAMLSLATEEAEVVSLIAKSNLQRIQEMLVADG